MVQPDLRHFGLSRAAAHSDCCCFAPYLLTYQARTCTSFSVLVAEVSQLRDCVKSCVSGVSAKILARMSRGCYAENGPVEFRLHSVAFRLRTQTYTAPGFVKIAENSPRNVRGYTDIFHSVYTAASSAARVSQNHRVKYIFYLESIRPIRTAEDFEAVEWATGFANKHGCIVGLLKETGSVFVKVRT